MPNGLSADPTSQIAALQERVHGLGQQFLAFEQASNRSFQQVESAIATLSAEFRAGGKTQWQTIVTAVGVLVTVLGALGTLAYMPIKSGMDGLSAEVRVMREAIVPRSEHAQRWQRVDHGIDGLEAGLRRLEERSVPRSENDERWRLHERLIAEMQRQGEQARAAGR
jgi:hypothetical protein